MVDMVDKGEEEEEEEIQKGTCCVDPWRLTAELPRPLFLYDRPSE